MINIRGKVSLYQNITDTNKAIYEEFDEIIEHIIRNPTTWFKELSMQIRAEKDKDKYKELKLKLPLMVASGKFEKRENAGLKEYSNILILDFDFSSPTSQQIEEFRKKLIEYATPLSLYAIWRSPGHGIKAAMLHDNTDPAFHSELFDSVKRNLFPRTDELDPCSKALSQGCFLSYDPDIFVNVDPNLREYHFIHNPEYQPSTPTIANQRGSTSVKSDFTHTNYERLMNSLWQAKMTDKRVADIIHKAADRANPDYYKDGNRHDEIKRRATFMCKDGVLFETALWSMQGKFGPGTRANFPIKDIQGMVNSIYHLARCDFGVDRDEFVAQYEKHAPHKPSNP